MTKHPLNADELLGSREIGFIDRHETNFPNLMRLCTDFDFCVLQLLHRVSAGSAEHSPVTKAFILVTRDYRLTPTAAISPSFAELEQLETYVRTHQVDILHDYLFGFVDEDIISHQAASN